MPPQHLQLLPAACWLVDLSALCLLGNPVAKLAAWTAGQALTLKLGSAYADALSAAERFSAAVVAAACNLATTKSAGRCMELGS